MAGPQYTALIGSSLAPFEVDRRDEGDPGPLPSSTRLARPGAESPARTPATARRPQPKRSLQLTRTTNERTHGPPS